MKLNLLALLFGTKKERDVKALLPLLHKVNAKEAWALGLKPEDFPRETERLKARYKAGGEKQAAKDVVREIDRFLKRHN